MREIVCRNNGRFSLEGNGEEVSTKVILNLKSTVDGVIVENMQNYDILLLKEGTFYDCIFELLVTKHAIVRLKKYQRNNKSRLR